MVIHFVVVFLDEPAAKNGSVVFWGVVMCCHKKDELNGPQPLFQRVGVSSDITVSVYEGQSMHSKGRCKPRDVKVTVFCNGRQEGQGTTLRRCLSVVSH